MDTHPIKSQRQATEQGSIIIELVKLYVVQRMAVVRIVINKGVQLT